MDRKGGSAAIISCKDSKDRFLISNETIRARDLLFATPKSCLNARACAQSGKAKNGPG